MSRVYCSSVQRWTAGVVVYRTVVDLLMWLCEGYRQQHVNEAASAPRQQQELLEAAL